MLNGLGEPILSFHTCRFVVYISTFAKPMGLYLTLLFSIERLLTKNLSNLILPTNHHRLLFKRLLSLLIFISIGFIFSIRLYEILKFIQKNPTISNSNIISQNDTNSNKSLKDQISFQYCYSSIDFDIYAKIISFYIAQYWFEYVILIIIILIFLYITVSQYCPPFIQKRSIAHLSINTKFYLSLASCVILFELVLLLLHFFLTNADNDNSNPQVNYLQTMLFAYNFRCILLPFIICLTICDPLKRFVYQLIIQRPYLDNFNDNNQTKTSIDEADFFSSSLQ